MRQQLHGQVFLHWRQKQQKAEEVGKEARQNKQQTRDNQRHAFDHLFCRAFACSHLLLHYQEIFETLVTHQRHADDGGENHQNQRQQDAQYMGNLDKNGNLNVNIEKESNKWYPAHWHLL